MKLTSLALFALTLTACSHTAHVRTDDSAMGDLPATNPDSVKVYPAQTPRGSYDILGVVMASRDMGENSDDVLKLLREEAAKLGADAVVEANMTGATGFWQHGFNVEGLAVKYKR